ncbi:MAG: hypothetical protein AB1782_11100 [Cyanobacteriota bacterium]
MSGPNSQDTPWYGKSYDTDHLIKKFIPSGDLFNKTLDRTFFRSLLENITEKPYWVKQAIYLELRDDIKQMTNVDLLEAIDKNDLLQLYVPKLSTLGKKCLEDKGYAASLQLSEIMKRFLYQVDGHKNVVELCCSNRWNLKQFADIIIEAEEKGFVEHIKSNQILNVFKYIADELDIGTLLVRLNKITPDQLSFAEFTMNESNKAFAGDEETTLEEVLIRVNYVTKDQLNSLLVLKKASTIVAASEQNTQADVEVLQESLEIITSEKQKVEDQLKEFKPLLDAKDRRIKELEAELEKLKADLLKYQDSSGKGGIFKKI